MSEEKKTYFSLETLVPFRFVITIATFLVPIIVLFQTVNTHTTQILEMKSDHKTDINILKNDIDKIREDYSKKVDEINSHLNQIQLDLAKLTGGISKK